MVNAAEDISIVLSGGATNINPNLSLGGAPSSAPVTENTINNLFDDVSPEETEEGHEDYRCFYFFNDGVSSVYDIELWILDDFDDGATMEVGVQSNNEVQRITLSSSPTGGYMGVNYAGHEFDSTREDLQDWATTLQNEFNNLSVLRDVEVLAQSAGQTVIFDITFGNRDGSRNHPVVQITDHLTPNVDITVATTLEGSPVNTVAPEIDSETTPPGGVGFYAASEISPITIPRLDPEDGFPVWAKRVVVAESDAKERDGFKLRFSAQTLEPAS
jgi:hypothetical protein